MFRLKVLEAHGPYPTDPAKAAELRHFRAVKASWDTYLFSAYACGMFQEGGGGKGRELLGRLRGLDNGGFRSAMAECMTCWFFAGKMGLSVEPYAPGRGGKKLDMRLLVDGNWIGVEVKSPFRERPKPPPGKSTITWCGDDADKIKQCMEDANKQFCDDRPNLLVIVPELRMHVFSHRRDVVKAAYGQSKITFWVDTQTGESGPVEVKLFQDGKFLNKSRPNGKPLKPDGLPAYRRISAILCLEEKVVDKYPPPTHSFVLSLFDQERLRRIWPILKKAWDLYYSRNNEKWVEHDVIVLHNPYAYHALSPEMWRAFPQLVFVDGEMRWTDGYRMDA